jgi:hypothetical protein
VDLSALGKSANKAAVKLREQFSELKLSGKFVQVDPLRASPGEVKDALKRIIHHLQPKADYRVLVNAGRVSVVMFANERRSARPKKQHGKKSKRHGALAVCPHCGKMASSQSEYWGHVQAHYVGFR